MGIRTIVEYHTSFINALVQRGGLLTNKKIYLMADKLVVLSKTDEVFWRDKGVDAQYIPNPFNLSYTNEEKIAEEGKHILLWVGKINQKYKRVFDLVPIIVEIKKRVPDIKLYVLGAVIDQGEAESFEKKIRDKGLDDNIVICGFRKNVEYYYRRASIMLMTSPGEGFPMALAEAKMYGLPTVMYDLPYLELVKDGQGVITVNKGDITSYVYEVVSLLENDNKRMILSEQARKSAEYFINYDIASEWEIAIDGLPIEEMSEENKRKERALIWRLMDESRGDMDNKKLEEIRELDLEDRIRLQKKYQFVDWYLTPKVDKAYIDSIIKEIISLANDDETTHCITEVGCGLGDIIGDSLLNSFKRMAYDLNNDVIEACKERYEGRNIAWNVGSFNDIKGEVIDFFVAVNFIHSIKPEYLGECFRNIFNRNKVRYLFVDKVTGQYQYTHDFEALLPERVHEISRYGPFQSDGGNRYILLFENEKYLSKEEG